ncbi:MAG: VWA domain-containing protein [Oscillospiraceae bacterium]|nr:VWA domain-containing protein [Oscillospiraceae bacterium]
MKNDLLQKARKLNTGSKIRKRWHRVVSVLAATTVFCTTYMLILPAITMDTEAICGMEEHLHSESCFGYVVTTELQCALEEGAGAHTHAEECFDEQGTILCALEESAGHVHTETCYVQVQQEEPVLVCTLAEHTHDVPCYPVESEDMEQTSSEYLCGMGVHAHMEGCYDEAGALVCTIPAHDHAAECIVADLDVNADVETPEQWEAAIAQLTFTGDWRQDVLTVAASQLGYTESIRNVQLRNGELKGYTRYGARLGDAYCSWDAAFAAFCLEYAGITQQYIPYGADPAGWVQALAASGQFAASQDYTYAMGDLVFVDTNADGAADRMGFTGALNADGTLQMLAGDTANAVGYETVSAGIVGYGILPQNPLSMQEWADANAMARMLAELPDAQQVQQAFEDLNAEGDKAGYEALRQELTGRLGAIYTAYEAFNELQKQRAGDLAKADALKEVCGGAAWRTHPVLVGDDAVVSGLRIDGVEILSAPQPEDAAENAAETSADAEENSEETAEPEEPVPAAEEQLPEGYIRRGDTLIYTFSVDTQSYYTDIQYGEALVKIEMVLPVDSTKAVFDTAAMPWMEHVRSYEEYRTVNDKNTLCQVLVGYKRLRATEEDGVVVPGSFSETVYVQVGQLLHKQQLSLIVSASMEFAAWDEPCAEHGVVEKLTVASDPLTVWAPLTAEEQQANYEKYLALLGELQTAQLAEEEYSARLTALEEEIIEQYVAGALNEEHYSGLNALLLQMTGVDLETIAEPSVGDGWFWLHYNSANRISSIGTQAVAASAQPAQEIVPVSAMPEKYAASLGLDSNSQIPADGWGGENSQDDVIWVSKTIEGTEQENIFDITLQIITREKINEVYKDPDMAVVIVMDISNTMASIFSGETTVSRYDAAMDSAEAFMKSFAEETTGLSKLGYVAFNTHGHEVFAMQECSTAAQAAALSTIMRDKTEDIMDKAAAAAGTYASSHDRFTNMEAGLKMAQDMLAGVNNRHKYVIFLSDGFPTTYMTASSTDGYAGYDPYTTSGSNGSNGVFYDRVMGHHCDYGTSYSDTAAIKARQQAVRMKDAGINIFSIGVDVEGQTIYEYHWDSALRLKTASTVERRQNTTYYDSTGYEIGTMHSELTASVPTKQEDLSKDYAAKYLTEKQRTDMSNDFKNWLRGSAKAGIGSNFYYDSTDKADLSAAYEQIFEEILIMNAESAHLDWVATDPMPEMGVHELDTMEFIGFWDIYGSDPPVLVQSLTGESVDGSLYYNTAAFDTTETTIHWDLKNSGYQSVSLGTNKNYMCALKYRVRLQNEHDGFVERQSYVTNDTTFLNYRVIEVVNNVTQVSGLKRIEFPIPKVFGYLAELEFTKVDSRGGALPGAKFTLTHDTAACGTCRGDGVGHVDLEVMEAVSGLDGLVHFGNIPSGHSYILQETEVPRGHQVNGNSYHVTVSYDALTVTVTDRDGNEIPWDEYIVNYTEYTLPETGGAGTHLYTFGGLLVLAAAALMYINMFGRKRQKGDGS